MRFGEVHGRRLPLLSGQIDQAEGVADGRRRGTSASGIRSGSGIAPRSHGIRSDVRVRTGGSDLVAPRERELHQARSRFRRR